MDILEALYQEGVPVFNMGSNANTIDVGWGTEAFHKMGREKVILVNEFLSMGYDLVMCDTDMVWLKVTFIAFHLCLFLFKTRARDNLCCYLVYSFICI